MADNEKTVTIKILGDASDFKKTMKDVQSVQSAVGAMSEKYQKSGAGGQKSVQKMTGKMAKQQMKAGKEALAQEKALQRAMKDSIKLIQEKNKKGQSASKKELNNLKEMTKAHKEIYTFRKSTGYLSNKELSESNRSMGESNDALRRKRSGRQSSAVGGALRSVGGLAMGAVVGLIGAAIGTVVSQISAGHGAYVGYGRQAASLSGAGANISNNFVKTAGSYKLGGRDVDKSTYKLQGFEASQAMGYSATDTLGHMVGAARATGGGPDLQSRTQMFQNLSRQYGGGDVGEVTSFAGGLTQASGKLNQREFQRSMSHALQSGMDKSRAGEAMQAMGAAVAAGASVSGGAFGSSEVTGLMAFLGRQGGPALQGARGLNVLGGFDNAIKQAGSISTNGEATKAMVLQAFGFGRAGGDTADYFTAVDRAQQGVFGKGGTKNLMDLISQVDSTTGGGREADYTLSGMTGVSMRGVHKVREAMTSGGTPEEIEAKIAAIVREEQPVDAQIKDATLDVAQHAASIDNHLIEFGKSTYESITQMQDLAQEMTEFFLPVAVAALNLIADTLTTIWEALVAFHTDYMGATASLAEAAAIKKEEYEIQRKVLSGEMEREDAVKALGGLSDRSMTAAHATTQVSNWVGMARVAGAVVSAVHNGAAGWESSELMQNQRAVAAHGQNANRATWDAGHLAMGVPAAGVPHATQYQMLKARLNDLPSSERAAATDANGRSLEGRMLGEFLRWQAHELGIGEITGAQVQQVQQAMAAAGRHFNTFDAPDAIDGDAAFGRAQLSQLADTTSAATSNTTGGI